ncbi:hypothetical protein P167DRAFT_550448 [Morchella conica CCBAS932]|uniref:Uncharacterized protein n=1 Tax=Morchella conica CCBAS932 TaxID=1392247 RepID=A0A3N4KAT3_9PEZI|nr:hypothetical protein P167DRAFT_550448 [Morchella conica CCBAS932]
MTLAAADLLTLATHALSHTTSPMQLTLRSTDERQCARQQLAVIVQAAAHPEATIAQGGGAAAGRRDTEGGFKEGPDGLTTETDGTILETQWKRVETEGKKAETETVGRKDLAGSAREKQTVFLKKEEKRPKVDKERMKLEAEKHNKEAKKQAQAQERKWLDYQPTLNADIDRRDVEFGHRMSSIEKAIEKRKNRKKQHGSRAGSGPNSDIP